jgi:uncharacterized DUF497 family protein
VGLLPEFFEGLTGFQWDDGNAPKVWGRHQVLPAECEQVFLNRPVLIAQDVRHSGQEARHHALGRSDAGRRLALVFTIRGPLVRVIAARDMSRRERKVYEQARTRT